MKRLLLFALIIPALWNCQNSNFSYGNMIILESDGALLPVLMHGNVESGIFLIRVHGSPGRYSIASQYTEIDSDEFSWDTSLWGYSADQGEQIALVDYDQRTAGTAQGNSTPEQFTLDQFIKDLDKVVDLVNELYKTESIFMIGHSFGGLFGTAYLLDPFRQAKIEGWIEMGGAHNPKLTFELSRQFVISYAEAQIAADNETGKWLEILAWYEQNTVISIDNIQMHSYYVDQAYGYSSFIHVFEVAYTMRPEIIFDTPVNAFAILFNTQYTTSHFDIWQMDLSPEMYKITPQFIDMG